MGFHLLETSHGILEKQSQISHQSVPDESSEPGPAAPVRHVAEGRHSLGQIGGVLGGVCPLGEVGLLIFPSLMPVVVSFQHAHGDPFGDDRRPYGMVGHQPRLG